MVDAAMGWWFVAVNVLFWCCIFLLQQAECALGRLPRRSKRFLYLQDWHTSSWGDLVGLSLLDFAFGTMRLWQQPNRDSIVALAVAFCITLLFVLRFGSVKHRPDAGAPTRGRFSWNGGVHMCYFFLQLAVTVALVWQLALGGLAGMPLTLALLGGALYLASLVADLCRGIFAFKKRT